jgi:hypothetical protein
LHVGPQWLGSVFWLTHEPLQQELLPPHDVPLVMLPLKTHCWVPDMQLFVPFWQTA